MKRRLALLCGCFSLILATSAKAETFRCGGRIVDESMNQNEVLQLCGEPDARSNQSEIKWIYRRGDGNLSIAVYFYANGDVERIESVHE